jgi:hypothetical protein
MLHSVCFVSALTLHAAAATWVQPLQYLLLYCDAASGMHCLLLLGLLLMPDTSLLPARYSQLLA